MKNHLGRSRNVLINGLFLIYLLFLGQEVVLTQVWCLKYNGTIDLEYTLFNYQCQCTHTHSGERSPYLRDSSCSIVQSFPGEYSCFNIPVENSRLVRELTEWIIFFKYLQLSEVVETGPVYFQSCYQKFFRNFPLSKFIYTFDYLVKKNIFRC